MTRLLVLVEGQTEEAVVHRVLAPHLADCGVHCIPTIVETRRMAGMAANRGGIASWERVRRDLTSLLNDSSAWVTTLLDFYALPRDFPGLAGASAALSVEAKATRVEEALRVNFPNSRRFIPFLAVHELEAWVFAGPSVAATHFGQPQLQRELERIVKRAGSPEAINDGPNTHPSSRLKRLVPSWKKTSDGPLILQAIGVQAIRSRCAHFNAWLTRLEALRG